MPRALPPAVRQVISNRVRQGQSPAEIAKVMDLHERTIRRIMKQFEEHGKNALQPRYNSCGVSQGDEYVALRDQVLNLRRQHPLWGAGRLLLELEMLSGTAKGLPSERTLQRWLCQEFSPAPAGRPRQDTESRAEHPHQVWQVDAVEQKRLANGQQFSWLRVADECSGAVLKTVVFSRRAFSASCSFSGATRIPQHFQGMGMSK